MVESIGVSSSDETAGFIGVDCSTETFSKIVSDISKVD